MNYLLFRVWEVVFFVVVVVVIQITHYQPAKKTRKAKGSSEALKPFEALSHLIFSFGFSLCVIHFSPFVVCATLLPHDSEYPSHSLLIVFRNDFF